MASKYLDIVADIKSWMLEIPDIGVVWEFERWANTWSKFLDFFKYTTQDGTTQIRGWEITRPSVRDEQKGAYLRHHRFKLTGYMSLKDLAATDLVFQELVDLVLETFREAQDPAGRWFYLDENDDRDFSIQADNIYPRKFGDVLCHCAEISLSVVELR